MNKAVQQSMVSKATSVLADLLGQPVLVTDQVLEIVEGIPQPVTGRLSLGEHTFSLMVKTAPHLRTLSLLQPVKDQALPPLVIVSSYITPAVGQALQRRGIGYLDTAGNAFLQATAPPLFVLIQGRRPVRHERTAPGRAFQPAGLRLLYYLLGDPALLQAPYRTLADVAQLSLGSVSTVLADLRALGLLREESTGRRWLDAPQVLRRWVEGYGAVLRPKLAAQRYRWLAADLDRTGWQQLPLDAQSRWGGEPAASLLLDGYLLPEQFMLYSAAPRRELLRQLRLVPDPAGTVEVLAPFDPTPLPAHPDERTVSPLLAYADLLLSADPRNQEVAGQLHARYLSYLT